jgi:hypothetical protein
MNTRRTPARIVAAQHSDQISNLLRHFRAPRLAAADSPRPKQAKTFAMPRNDCLGFDDHQGRLPITPSRRSHTQKIRSARVSFSRLGAARRKTVSCCRKARFSRRSWAEVLTIEVRTSSTESSAAAPAKREHESQSTSMITGQPDYFGGTVRATMPISWNQKLNRACSSNLRLLADSENPVPPRVPTPYG